MADNVFDQFDSAPAPAAAATPPPAAKGNPFDQFDTPAPPPAQAPAPGTMPKVPASSVASLLGHNPLAGVYTPPGQQPDTNVAPQNAPQAQQQQPAPTPQAQPSAPQGGAGAQPPGAPQGQPAQQPQSNAQAKAKEALTPPDLSQSAIPEPVSPNPPPPQTPAPITIEAATQQAGVTPNSPVSNPQALKPFQQDVFGRQTMTDMEPVDQRSPDQTGLPPGAYRDAQGVIHNPNTPHWLDVVLGTSQRMGNAIQQTGSSMEANAKELTPKTAAVAAAHGFVGNAGAATEKAVGQTMAGMTAGAVTPPMELKPMLYDQALKSGNMYAYDLLKDIPEDQLNEAFQRAAEAKQAGGEQLHVPFQETAKKINEAGKQVVEAGAGTQDWWNNWAKQNGVDPAKLHAVGAGASVEGMLDAVGTQANQLLITHGVGQLGAKGAMIYMAKADPALLVAATKGVPVAQDAVKRVSNMASTYSIGTAQAVYVSGVAGAEASEQVKKTPFDQLMLNSPEFKELVQQGGDPKEVREDLAMRAGYRAQTFAFVTAMAADHVGGAAAQKIPAGKVKNVAQSATSNAVLQGSLQASTNYGLQLADASRPIMQGVLGETAGGAFIGGVFGALLPGGEESATDRSPEEAHEAHGALKRAELVAKARAGQDNVEPDQRDAMLRQAETINKYRKAGQYSRAAEISGTEIASANKIKQQEKPSFESVREAAADQLKTYLAAPDNDKKLGPVGHRMMLINALDRWSQVDGGRTRDEYVAAAKRLSATGELPPEVQERIGEDFNNDGTLNQSALTNDVRLNPGAQILHARVDPGQSAQVVSYLRDNHINPYVTEQGDVALLGRGDDLTGLQEKLAEQFGLKATVTENHYGQAYDQAATHAQDQGQPSEAENPEGAEGRGAHPEGDGLGADEARQVLTDRSQPVIDRLEEAGVKASVAGDGRVTVMPGHENGEDVIGAAANDSAESAENDRREPTPAQKRQGNYPKGKLLFASPKGDIPVNIESPAGSIRKSLPGEKPAWSRKVTEHYGYIPGTYSADGEPVDVLVGRQSHDDTRPIFVMQQTKKDGSFDEHKVVMGARSEREARDMYLKQYPASMHESLLQGQTKMVRMSREQFADWLKRGDHDVPIHPMSKAAMLKLRPAPGNIESTFEKGGDYLQDIANSINKKYGAAVQVDGNKLTGTVDQAKAPAVIRSLKRAEGHEQTQYNGNEPGALLRREGERDSRRVLEGRAGRQAAAPAHESSSQRVPQRGGQAKEEAPQPRWLNRPTSDAPRHAEGKGANPVEVVGVHYSKDDNLSSVDVGGEKTLDNPQTFTVRQSRDLPKAPAGSGEHAYEARLGNLYDVRSDPDGIIGRAEEKGLGGDKDAIMLAIKRGGYDGALMPTEDGGGRVLMVGKQSVPVKSVTGEQYIFGGMGAREPAEFSKVGRSINAGKTSEEIHAETGWHKGGDGKWRFEIDDSGAAIKPESEWLAKAKSDHVTMGDVLDHPELYKQYPHLKDYEVQVRKEYEGHEFGKGEAVNSIHNKQIVLGEPDKYIGEHGDGTKVDSLKSVLIHELQHSVQESEGFSRGGGMAEFEMQAKRKISAMQSKILDMKNELQLAVERGDVPFEQAEKEYNQRFDEFMEEAKAGHYFDTKQARRRAFDLYKRLGGEVEARNAQKRLDMSPAARRAVHPEATQDIPSEEHIHVQGDKFAPDVFKKESEHEQPAAPAAEARGLRGRGRVSGGEGSLPQPRPSADFKPVESLEGLPGRVKVNGQLRSFGANQVAHEAAQRYAAESGVGSARPKTYAKVNEARAKRIANAYEAMQHAPNDPAVKKSYRALINETMAQWRQIEKTGLKVSFIKPGEAYPYKNPREVFEDVEKNNHMWVYPTTEGFGGSESAHVDISGNPLLEKTGITLDGHPTVANDIFRIVHDYFGHIKEGVGFRAEGEENAWRSHASMYSPLARRAMTTETRGQNSWVNYGPYGEFNKTANGEETQYAPRKAGLLPDWVSEEGRSEPYSPQEAKTHVDEIQAHVDSLRESWANGPDVRVVADRHELPEPVAKHLDVALGGDAGAQGLYYGGKVYLLGDAIADKPHAEYVLTHETMGHYGLRKTFGAGLDNLLSEIHDSIKDTPEFKRLSETYADAYAGLGLRERELATTEEYLSNRATLAGNRSVLQKAVAFVRRWGRQMGMVRDWSQNDILNMMQGVSQNVREGRVSRFGWPVATTTFNDELGRATTSYEGAAGEGQMVTKADGSRELQVGNLKATVSRVMSDAGTGMLVGKLKYEDPADLLRITRLAGEEGKGYVLFPRSAEADLKAANIPAERVGDMVQTPASRVDDQPARFSLKNMPADAALRDRIDRVLQRPESSMSPWDRFQELGRKLGRFETWAHWGRRFIQQAVDRFEPIAHASMQMHGGTLLDASEDAYKMANMSQNTREVMGGIMKLGVPEYRNGSFEPVNGRKGLMNILMPLFQHQEKGFDRMWEFYAMARRGDQLSKMTNPDGTSKEKLLSDEDIKEGLALGQKYPVMAKVFDDWQEFNKQLLDLAVERGNMTKDMADLWKQNDYVPFYRVAGDDDLAPLGHMPGGMAVKSKRLTGSDRQVEPIIENIVNNTASVLRKVYRNEALRRAAALGENVGAVERMPTQFRPVRMNVGEIEKNLEKLGLFVGQQANATSRAKLQITPEQADKWTAFFRAQAPMGADTFSVMENGKPVYYKGIDHDYLQAVNSIKSQQQLEGWFTKLFGAPKNFLTHAITLNPAFMLRHLERQATHTWIQSGENFNPFSHAIENAKDAYTNSEFMQKMSLAGAGGNEYYDIDQLRESMRGLGVHSTILDSGHKVWMAYRKIGFVADQMNRMGIAKSVLARGGSTAEAAWQAQDLLNFRMHGDGVLMRHLIAAVPFLNARVQGMYRIMRGARGIDQSFKSRQRAVVSFLVKSATLIAASQMMALKNNGDPRYERLPEEAKDLYWHVFVGDHHFAIAKPFELGAVFSTLPDRAVRYAEGLDGSHTFRSSLWRVLDTVFRFDPTPAAINPLVQDWKNKDDLTQRPIVPENLQSVDARMQFNPYTSPTLKAVAQHMPEFAPDIVRSPLRMQHLVDGYVGSLGEYAINAADSAVRATGGAPAGPASRLGGGSVLDTAFGSMAGRVSTDPRNRYSGMIFEQKKQLDQIAQTVSKMKKQGDVEELNRYYMQHKTLLQYRGEILEGYRQMENIRKAEQTIYSDPRMSPQEKREALDKITKQQNAYLDKLAPMLNLADSAL